MVSVASHKQRLAWEDRFREPSLDELREHYNKQLTQLLDSIREYLLGFSEVSERIEWQGLPWRWTLTYSNSIDSGRAWAYVVPQPPHPVLAVPLTSEMVRAMPVRRLKKHVRDGLTTSKKVGEVHWATWEISSKSQLEEVLDVVKRKHQFVQKQTSN